MTNDRRPIEKPSLQHSHATKIRKDKGCFTHYWDGWLPEKIKPFKPKKEAAKKEKSHFKIQENYSIPMEYPDSPDWQLIVKVEYRLKSSNRIFDLKSSTRNFILLSALEV